jgi:RHS repeat-associated protein
MVYDASGNLQTINGNTATYNAENQITNLSNGTANETMKYDSLGERVQKAVSAGATTVYVYDIFGLATEYSGAGATWSRDYIRNGRGQLIATENAAGGVCATCYFTVDHLGGTRMVTDSGANVKARHDYLPFGEEIAAGSAGRDSNFGPVSDVALKFTGQVRDEEAGQDFFNARYFTPALGRFNSPDPRNAGASLLSSQSWNGYVYVLGNPMNASDPSGRDCFARSGPRAHIAGCEGNYGVPEYGGVSIDGGGTIAPGTFGTGSNGAGGESAVQCPNNICTGSNQFNLPIQYYATASGTNYYACMTTGLWSTQQMAGIVGIACSNGMSIAWNLEVYANIYETNGQYSFNLPRFGTQTISPTIFSDVPDGTAYAGYFHTHGAFQAATDLYPSPADSAWFLSPGNKFSPIYIGTPFGGILMLDPSTFPDYSKSNGWCVLMGNSLPQLTMTGPNGTVIKDGRVTAVPVCH